MSAASMRSLSSTAPTLILYHAECADGFGAAWAIWRRYPERSLLRRETRGGPPPDLAGEHIVIVDFSYARPILETMAQSAASLVVLDHHITAEQTLADLPYAYFDLTKSGAVLGWEWAHDEPAPWLLRYIQDKDLWHWALPNSREISAALASYPFDFALWSSFQQQELEWEGRAILRYENELVAKLASHATMVQFEGVIVPAVHSPLLTSQIGERLSNDHPFCLIWHDRNGRRYYSMRSREDGTDVGSIAASFGGGGHTHAAGFSIPLQADGSLPSNPRLPRPAP